jgi:pyruvate dehydrogenase E2 component (dihydrolipoamide acetyltransferase)
MPITITMPALSPTMTEGTLAKWLMNEGDNVAPGDLIAEIETDKATMEVEAVDEGTLARILVPEGTEGVPVNTPIAVILEEGEDTSALEGFTPAAASAPAAPPPPPVEAGAPAVPEAAAVAAPAPPTETAPQPATASPAPSTGANRLFASPLARRMAADAGIDLALISGSGPRGRIVKADVEAAIAAGPTLAAAAPAPSVAAAAQPFEAPFELEPLNAMRKTIARRMTESKQQVPHFYMSVDCEIDKLLELRQDLNARADGAYRLSVNDMVIKAAAVALTKVPAANASYSDEGLKYYASADIAVAVATKGGLITPVVRQAHAKGLEQISNEMKELADKAKDGKLMPEEYQGGTFSISNLGMYGIKQFDAVINPPQGCILAVAAGEQRPVVRNGGLAVATVMTCTLSVDHRVVDGAVGAQWLASFKGLVQDPMTMLL